MTSSWGAVDRAAGDPPGAEYAGAVNEQDRPAPVDNPSWLGRRVELRIESVAHGGHCVARHEGRVIFVRHTLPGEVVLAEITEDRGGSFCRADAIEVLASSPDRVTPPCPYAHPGGCGGCDFQHVALAAQRGLKADVVAEQLRRLAGLEWPVTVEELGSSAPDGNEHAGLGWRRRVRFAVAPDGQLGLRAHRSHTVIALDHCPIGAPGVGDSSVLGARWIGVDEVEVAADDEEEVAVLSHREVPVRQSHDRKHHGGKQHGRGTRTRTSTEHVAGPELLRYSAAGRHFEISAGNFWQTHPRAADVFTEQVLAGAELAAGEKALDLYAGSGLFTAALAGAVGPTGQVLGLEAAGGAVHDAASNLADLPWARVRRVAVTGAAVTAAVTELDGVAVIVLDPPRTGAGREVMSAMLSAAAGSRPARPRAIVYVACDPAALARDVGTATEAGWRLDGLRAFDAFPMTHHVECIAVLRPEPDRAAQLRHSQ